MTVIDITTNDDGLDILEARENLNAIDQKTTTDEYKPNTPVTEEIEFNDNPNSNFNHIEEKIDESKAVFETDTIDTDMESQDFPDAFYDPFTKELMKDPVVVPDGNSYERSAIMEARGYDIESSGTLYPNRALLAVINETVRLSGDSFEAGMRRLSKTIKTSMRQLISRDDFRPLPDVFYCPITFGLIHFPVIDAEGNTFEKVAIEAWIQRNGKSPITRTPLSKEDLYDNHAITALLEIEKGKNAENMHPSIQNFISSSPPEAPDLPPINFPPNPAEVQTFPITPEELEERRRRIRNEEVKTAIILVFLFGGLFIALGYFSIYT